MLGSRTQGLRCLKFEGMWLEFWLRWTWEQDRHPKVRTIREPCRLPFRPPSWDRFGGSVEQLPLPERSRTIQNHFLAEKSIIFGRNYFFGGKKCRNYFHLIQKMAGTISFSQTFFFPLPVYSAMSPNGRMGKEPRSPGQLTGLK